MARAEAMIPRFTVEMGKAYTAEATEYDERALCAEFTFTNVGEHDEIAPTSSLSVVLPSGRVAGPSFNGVSITANPFPLLIPGASALIPPVLDDRC